MISFLAPAFLAGIAAAAVPIVLHLLKREPEPRVKFAVVKLLKRAPVEDTEKHRLRELLLLALRVATLVLLALAFARPFMASGEAVRGAGVTVVALDTSYSMSAPGRFERAKQAARDAINGTSPHDLVAVVTFADEGEIVAKPSADRVLATSAIDQATTGAGATRYRSALSAAAQTLAGRTGTIVVVTDLQESGWDAGDRVAVPERARIEVIDVGEMPANLAVTSVRPQPDRVVATIQNAGPRARDVRAHLAIDGRPAGEAVATIAPNQTADVTFAGAPRGVAAAVSVDDRDGIQADNVRYAVLAGTRRPTVLVVTGSGTFDREGFYVSHALVVGERGGRGYEVTASSGAQLSSTTDDRLAAHAAIVLTSTRGLERRGREALAGYVRNGGGLLIAAGPDVDGEVVSDVLGAGATIRLVADNTKRSPRTLAPSDVRHPVFRPFAGTAATLALVRFQNAARISATGCPVLANFTTGDAAMVECSAGEGRALVLGSDLDNRWNDFPLHASFVPFLHEVVAYLASGRAHASDYFIGDAPAGVPRTPGVHEIASPSGGAPRRVAVNVDPREADPSRLSLDEFQSAVTRLEDVPGAAARIEARQQEDDQHLWQFALALMLVALAVEGVLAARTA